MQPLPAVAELRPLLNGWARIRTAQRPAWVYWRDGAVQRPSNHPLPPLGPLRDPPRPRPRRRRRRPPPPPPVGRRAQPLTDEQRRLAEDHVRLARHLARRFAPGLALPRDEATSIALLGLVLLARRWRPGPGPFPAYLVVNLRREMWHLSQAARLLEADGVLPLDHPERVSDS